MRVFLLVAFLLGLAVYDAQAGEGSSVTSQELFGACSIQAPKRPADIGKNAKLDNVLAWAKYNRDMLDVQSCRYYILGIADGMGSFADLHGVKDCVPTTTMGNLADLYVKYYKNHPEHRHHEAKDLVVAAFIDGFGCRFDEKKKDTRS